MAELGVLLIFVGIAGLATRAFIDVRGPKPGRLFKLLIGGVLASGVGIVFGAIARLEDLPWALTLVVLATLIAFIGMTWAHGVLLSRRLTQEKRDAAQTPLLYLAGTDHAALLESLADPSSRPRLLSAENTAVRIAALPDFVRADAVETLLRDREGALVLLRKLAALDCELEATLRVLGEVGEEADLAAIHERTLRPNRSSVRQAASAAGARLRRRLRRTAEDGQLALVAPEADSGKLEIAAGTGALSIQAKPDAK